MSGLISQKVSMMYQTKSKETACFLHAILVHMATGGQDHTQKMLALLLK